MYGKTGSGFYETETAKIAWYVGWIEKEDQWRPFALLITGVSTYPTKEERQRLVIQFLTEAGLYE